MYDLTCYLLLFIFFRTLSANFNRHAKHCHETTCLVQ